MKKRKRSLQISISEKSEEQIANYFAENENLNSLSQTAAYLIDLGYRRAMALRKYAPKSNKKRRENYTPVPIAKRKCGRCRKVGHRRDECPKILEPKRSKEKPHAP
jgi:hypothetical protein